MQEEKVFQGTSINKSSITIPVSQHSKGAESGKLREYAEEKFSEIGCSSLNNNSSQNHNTGQIETRVSSKSFQVLTLEDHIASALLSSFQEAASSEAQRHLINISESISAAILSAAKKSSVVSENPHNTMRELFTKANPIHLSENNSQNIPPLQFFLKSSEGGKTELHFHLNSATLDSQEMAEKLAATQPNFSGQCVNPSTKSRKTSRKRKFEDIEEVQSILNEKERKKKVRLLKNRQSAALSRQRKKEYLQSLEQKCSQLILENSELQLKIQQISTTNLSKAELLEKDRIILELNRDNERLKKENEFLKKILCVNLISNNDNEWSICDSANAKNSTEKRETNVTKEENAK